MTPGTVVIDTNVVLDAFVFADPATGDLRTALAAAQLDWIATAPMRAELERVLGYPQVVRRLVAQGVPASAVLALFDRYARMLPPAGKAGATCKDPDDQCFIDLAVAHRASLLSKDSAVLCMAKRLRTLGAAAVGPVFCKPGSLDAVQ